MIGSYQAIPSPLAAMYSMIKPLDSGALLLILVPMMATALVTALFCYYQVARKKRISFWVPLLSACLVPFLMLFVSNLVRDGMRVFKVSYWDGDVGLMGLFVLLGFAAVLCLIPAAGVYVCFIARQAREK